MFRNENKWDREIREASTAFPSVPVYIVKAVIAQESRFNETAYNPEKGKPTGPSRGLMQMTERTARALGYGGTVENLMLPAINIYYGTQLLSENFRRAGNWPGTVSAYNGGFRSALGFGTPMRRTGVRCMGRIVPIGEFCNQTHVDKVLRYAAYFAEKEGVPQAALPFSVPPLAGAGMMPLIAVLVAGAILLTMRD